MKLISIKKLEKIGDADHYALVFENDGEVLNKTARVSGLAKTIDAERATREALYGACMEAERDFAYAIFGDEWREYPFAEHCAWKIMEFMRQ